MFRVFTCLTAEHDWRLVALAGVVCFLASFAAISLFHRARNSAGRTRALWIAAIGAITGGGIWATHFIAMLAYEPGVAIAYDIGLTSLSLVASILATCMGFAVAAQISARWGAPAGGVIVGGGIACMHYLGMWAAQMPGRVTWSTELVVVSILLGVAFGAAALTLAVRRNGALSTLLAACLLLLAIVSHHFTAMGAITIVADPTRVITMFSLSPTALAVTIASFVVVATGMSVVGAFAASRLREKNELLNTALTNMSQGLCMFDEGGSIVLCNERYLQMYGLSREIVKPGCSLRQLIEHRVATGGLRLDPDEYIRDIMATRAAGKKRKQIIGMGDGRTIDVLTIVMPDGGWVVTHEDISEQHNARQQVASMAEQEQRRVAIEAAIMSFRARVETVLSTVSESAASMRSTATALSGASDQTSQRAESAVEASNEASANTAVAAAAAEELLTSIGEIGRQLGHTTDVVRVAVGEAQRTNDEISGLAQAAQKIGDVVKLIRDIAGQTNLLALNATIEAARAGESGKGFAVVASEVKSLAVQTGKATEEIAGQIAAVQSSASGAVEAIRRIAARMQEINQHTSAVAASLQQQNSATDEISQNVANAAHGASTIVSALNELAGAATDTQSAAQTMLAASQAVETAAGNLRGEVETFLQKVAV